ncbi:hypothetical protein PROFUN_04440 [Planoprotostelium fungivorum]|uniref:Uncharacterized protein n=1 Tax=Planoprotostelium fungivorum TaxID=1890364 RepID=A0A2P6NVL6_9EUKA|nr:hypothetical protein PROFUN_04440 [Planoprotostelium fungivorum]
MVLGFNYLNYSCCTLQTSPDTTRRTTMGIVLDIVLDTVLLGVLVTITFYVRKIWRRLESQRIINEAAALQEMMDSFEVEMEQLRAMKALRD